MRIAVKVKLCQNPLRALT